MNFLLRYKFTNHKHLFAQISFLHFKLSVFIFINLQFCCVLCNRFNNINFLIAISLIGQWNVIQQMPLNKILKVDFYKLVKLNSSFP